MGESHVDGTDQDIEQYMELVANRAEFLEYLRDTLASKRDVIDDLPYSRSTVDRAIRDLEAAELVRRVDGGYRTTATGVLAVQEYRSHTDRITDIRATQEALAPIPPEAPISPEMVIAASVELTEKNNRYDALASLGATLDTASEIRGILPHIADSRYLDLYAERADAGASVSLVLNRPLRQTLQSQFTSICSEMVQQNNCRLYEADTPPFGVILTESGDETTVWIVVYAEGEAVHSIIESSRVEARQWAEKLFEKQLANADEVTEKFVNLETESADSRPLGAGGHPITGRDDDDHLTLPVSLESGGFIELTADYLSRREAASPFTSWQTETTLPEVAAGYAFDRTQETDDGRQNVTTAIFERLQSGQDCVVLGEMGAGKSTVCKSIAYRWYNEDIGRVFYREGGNHTQFQSVAQFRDLLRQCSGHTLVVVEDAPREEANAIFELMIDFTDEEAVTFLLDSRTWEWGNADVFKNDPRLGAFRQDAIESIELPAVDEYECDRFIDQTESVTNHDIALSPKDLLESVDESGPSESETPGETAVIFHMLTTDADPTTTVDAVETTETTGLVESVQSTLSQLADLGEQAVQVGTLANLLNAADLPIYPEYLYSLGYPDSYHRIDQAIELLSGTVLFDGQTAKSGAYRTVHESWSMVFLDRLLTTRGEADSHRLVARCLSQLSSLASDQTVREAVSDYTETYDRIDRLVTRGDWIDTLLTDVTQIAQRRANLAPLFGNGASSEIQFPDSCAEETLRECVMYRAGGYVYTGRFTEADEEFDYLLDLSESNHTASNGPSYRALAYHGKGSIAHRLGNYDEAESYLDRAIELFSQTEEKFWEADAYAMKAHVYGSQGAFETAESLSRTAIDIARQTDNQELLAKTAVGLGGFLRRQHRLEEAEEILREGIEAVPPGNELREANLLNSLGTLLLDRGHVDEAEEALRRSINISRRAGSQELLAAGLKNLARIETDRQQYQQALEHQQEALATFREMNQDRMVAICTRNLGTIYRRMDRLEAARSHLTESIELFDAIGNSSRLLAARRELGKTYRQDGDLEAAETQFQAALELARDVGSPKDEFMILSQLVDIFLGQGDTDQATVRYEKAIEVADDAGLGERKDKLVNEYGELTSTYPTD